MLILISLLFLSSGVTHFVRPQFFLDIMPPYLPWHRFWVYFTGVCEIAGAIGLQVGPTRTAAAWCLIALLVCVFPANIYMFQQGLAEGWTGKTFALLMRLPLQFLLIYWIYSAAGLSFGRLGS